MNIMADGFMVSEETGCDIYYGELNMEISKRLKMICNIFQAEVYAIVRHLHWVIIDQN